MQPVQSITPCLWFEDQAEDAVNFYTPLFNNSTSGNVLRYDEASAEVSGRPKGSVLTIDFKLEGQDFVALNGGPEFKFTPAISFFVNCKTPDEIDALWQKLSDGGTVLMELGTYPFSEKYWWVQDKFGVSWQLILANRTQKITPCLLFVGEQYGKAEAAMNLYTSVFPNSRMVTLERYGANEMDREDAVKYAVFSLNGQEFIAMESGLKHDFAFTLAISFMVDCKTQAEVDNFWEKLSEGGEPIECGWLTDPFGVAWQVVPSVLNDLLRDPDPEKSLRVMKAMLQMKKLDIDTLQCAAEPSLSQR